MNTPLKSLNQISHVALAIETVPNRSLQEYEQSVQDQINQKLAISRATDPGMTYDQFASGDPQFGRIICLTAGYIAENASREQVAILKSCTGPEVEILQEFDNCFGCFRNTIVHFGGRVFDVPFILTRMRENGVTCRNCNLPSLNRPNGFPHLDLQEYYAQNNASKRVPLGTLASLTGLPSPKVDLAGSTVWEAFQCGEIRRVARCCEFRVATVLNLLRVIIGGHDAIPSDRLYSVEADGQYAHLASAREDGSCPSVWDDDAKPYGVSSQLIPRLGLAPSTVMNPAAFRRKFGGKNTSKADERGSSHAA